MKYIKRWSLMRSIREENIMEHSHQVAVIAHALALIQNKEFGGTLDISKVVLLAQYHEVGEVITGDLPTPIKYFNPEINSAYKDLEKGACTKLLDMLPETLKEEYTEYILPDTLEAEYEPIIREILSFTKFGGIRSMYEARDLVIALFEGNVALAGFHDIDLNTGAWCIFVDETETAPRRYFYVSNEDTIREYFMEDQPIGGTGIVFRESEDTQ
jgi:hypothetical protein